MSFIHYSRLVIQMYYWRTNHGAEVDVLLCKGFQIVCALEVKSSKNIARESLSGLKSFMEDNPSVPAYVLGADQNRQLLDNNITVTNWNDFIHEELNLIIK